jgi:hypothetical protein
VLCVCASPDPVQQRLSEQEIQRTGLSTHASSSTINDTLKITTVVQQITRELSEAVSEENEITVITNTDLNETEWLLEFIGRSNS